MSRETRRFVRLYYDDLERDYPQVWFDPTCMSTYDRLLALADKSWPSRPQLPKAVRRADLAMLTAHGLVKLLDNDRFEVKGFDQERSLRAERGRANASGRWAGRGDAAAEQPQYDGNATALLTGARGGLASASASVTEEASEKPDPVVHYANLVGGFPSPKAMDWIDQLTEQYGADAVIRALAVARKAGATGVIGRAQDHLRAEARELSVKERNAEKAKVHERRLDGMHARRLEWFRNTGKWEDGWGPRPEAA